MNKRHRASGARGQEAKAMASSFLRGALNFINFGSKVLYCLIFSLNLDSISCKFPCVKFCPNLWIWYLFFGG